MRFSMIMPMVLALLCLNIVAAAEPCVSCSEFASRPQAHIIPIVDENTHTLQVTVSYENFSATPSMQPVSDSTIIVEVTNATGLSRIYRIYTDAQGIATFDFTQFAGACANFKALYCPFCDPASPACGFKQCLEYSGLKSVGYENQLSPELTSAQDIPDAAGATSPAELNSNKFLPMIGTAGYCAPPPPFALTPQLCLPLIIIFTLLGGALYMTGQNPLAAFNLGSQRVGKHIRYQARGRGFSLSTLSFVQAASSIGEAASFAGSSKVDSKTGKPTGEKQGIAGLARREAGAAADRGLMGGAISFRKQQGGGVAFAGIRGGIREYRRTQSMQNPTAGGKGSGAMAGSGKTGGTQTAQTVPGGGMAFTQRAGSIRTPSDLVGSTVSGTAGRIGLFVFSSTLLGSAVDSIYASAKGRSMFDAAYGDHVKNLGDGLKLLAANTTKEGYAKVFLEDGREVVVKEITYDKDKNTTHATLRIEVVGSEGKKIEVSVKINAKTGVVESATISKLDMVNKTFTYYTVGAAKEGYSFSKEENNVATGESKKGELDPKKDAKLISQLTDIAAHLPPEIMLGNTAGKQFIEAYELKKEAIDSTRQGVRSEIEAAKTYQHEQLGSMIAQTVDAEKSKPPEQRVFTNALASASKEEASRMLASCGLFMEHSPKSVETAKDVQIIREHNFGGDPGSGSSFDARLADAAGVGKSNDPAVKQSQTVVIRAVNEVIASASAEELARMTPSQFKTRVDAVVLQQTQNPIEKLPREGQKDVIDFMATHRVVMDSAKEFIKEVGAKGLNPEIAGALQSVPIARLNQVSPTDYTKPENYGALVAARPDMFSGTPEQNPSYRALSSAGVDTEHFKNVVAQAQLLGAAENAAEPPRQQPPRLAEAVAFADMSVKVAAAEVAKHDGTMTPNAYEKFTRGTEQVVAAERLGYSDYSISHPSVVPPENMKAGIEAKIKEGNDAAAAGDTKGAAAKYAAAADDARAAAAMYHFDGALSRQYAQAAGSLEHTASSGQPVEPKELQAVTTHLVDVSKPEEFSVRTKPEAARDVRGEEIRQRAAADAEIVTSLKSGNIKDAVATLTDAETEYRQLARDGVKTAGAAADYYADLRQQLEYREPPNPERPKSSAFVQNSTAIQEISDSLDSAKADKLDHEKIAKEKQDLAFELAKEGYTTRAEAFKPAKEETPKKNKPAGDDDSGEDKPPKKGKSSKVGDSG